MVISGDVHVVRSRLLAVRVAGSVVRSSRAQIRYPDDRGCMRVASLCSVSRSKCSRVRSSASGNVSMSVSGQDGLVIGKGSEGAWDAGGVGRAVVRRYETSEQESWLMWYEGWGTKPEVGDEGTSADSESPSENENKTPSCVGLAFSSNGLIWTRGSSSVETDSRGQGGAGRVLEPSKNWWSFDTRHVRVSDVIMMASPRVRASSGVFWMFYEGQSNEEMVLPESIPERRRVLLESRLSMSHSADIKAPLLRSRPGLAMSNDGRNWAAIEGEHHSGAVLDVGDEGEWDSLLIASPHVVFHGPGDLRMYYHSLDPNTGCFCIGMARSRDGLRWVKLGKALSGGTGLGYLNAQVMFNPFSDVAGLDAVGGYIMLYERLSEEGSGSICVAHSEDGLSGWQHKAVILEPNTGEKSSGDILAWDCGSVGSPCLVDMGDDILRLFYSGIGQDGSQGIGVAESLNGSFHFQRLGSLALYQ